MILKKSITSLKIEIKTMQRTVYVYRILNFRSAIAITAPIIKCTIISSGITPPIFVYVM